MTDWSKKYRYNYNYMPENSIVVEPVPTNGPIGMKTGTELNFLSRYIWGIGAAANTLFNAHGFMVKFQGDKDTNVKRSRLLTRVWRYMKRNGLNPLKLRKNRRPSKTDDYFEQMGVKDKEDFNELVKVIEKELLDHKTK